MCLWLCSSSNPCLNNARVSQFMFATDGMDISNSNKMKFVAGYLELGQPWMVRVALSVVLYICFFGRW